jgi:hypothetical protein
MVVHRHRVVSLHGIVVEAAAVVGRRGLAAVDLLERLLVDNVVLQDDAGPLGDLGDVLAGVGAVVVRGGVLLAVAIAIAIAIAGAPEHGCSLLVGTLGSIAMARRCMDVLELAFYRRASG